MKTSLLLVIAAFLVLLPWFQGLNIQRNGEVTVDGITISAVIVMPITLAFSLASWSLFSWASKQILGVGILLSIISGAALVIPFLEVLGPMAGVMVGVVAGFVAFMLQKKVTTSKNRPVVIAGVTLAAAYVVLTIVVLASNNPHVWDTGVGAWTGTTEGIEDSGFDNVFGNNIGFVFFLAIIPSLIMTGLVIREKN